MGVLVVLKRRSKVSKGFKEGFNVIFEVDMSDKLSVLDYSSQILNEIYLPMMICLGFFNLS